MGVFMFICKESGGEWSAKQYAKKEEDNKDLSAEASDLWTLGRQLVKLAVDNSSGGGVSSFFSYTTPSTGVYEVNVGGGGGMMMGGGGGGGGGAAAAGGAAAPAEEEKKEEKAEEKEESDDDMGFSLFD